jgi:uncharacterized protein involved in exopolysaccharide biosynthesis
MTQETKASEQTKKNEDPHILDYFTLWAQYKKQVLAIIALVSLLFVGITFLMPFTFTGTATLMPPEKEKSGGLMSFLSGSGALDLMKGQENPALDMFKNVIDSRVLSESIASDPRVHKYYSSFDTSLDAIAFMAHNNMTSEPLRNGVMNVQVEIKTHWFPSGDEKEEARHLAPYLANLFVHELDKFNRERLVTTAHFMREFTESQYNKRMEQLDSAYAHLQEFQETNKAVSLTEQLTATVTSAALLASQIQQLEMQIGVEERELTPNSARVTTLRAQLEEAKDQLKRYDDGSIGEYSIALTRVPELTRKLARLMREVKMLETISAYLRQQLEQERLNEQRNVPTFQMLDSAVLPLKKSSPKRSMILILGVITGLVFSGIYVGWKRFKKSLVESPEEHIRYLNLKNSLRRKRL